jgi:serine palmitoyltransferase
MYETFKPGGRLHPTYFLEHKGHLVIEAVCLLVIAYLSLHPRAPHRSRKQEAPLTEQARLERAGAHPGALG